MTACRLSFIRAALALVLPALLLAGALVPAPAAAQDASEFFLRLNRLENQVRDLAGTVERLEFENRRLKEQLERFQEDVEFRFQESSGAGAPAQPPARQKRSDIPPADPLPGGAGAEQEIAQTTTPAVPASSISADAVSGAEAAAAADTARLAATEAPAATDFSADTPAEGPRVLALPRIDTPAVTVDEEPVGAGRPLDLGAVAGAGQGTATDAAAAFRHPTAAAVAGEAETPGIPSVAATAPGDPQVGYRNAEASFRRQDYWAAEMGFREFLQSHPRDRLAPEATFFLGESYFFRGRYREAAEQYLKLTTTHATSPRAPDAMLKLGMSLEALGARDQACATLAETIRKFPDASPDVRQGVARARARANCA